MYGVGGLIRNYRGFFTQGRFDFLAALEPGQFMDGVPISWLACGPRFVGLRYFFGGGLLTGMFNPVVMHNYATQLRFPRQFRVLPDSNGVIP